MAPTVCFLSYRLGHADGVSVETQKWARVFGALGFRTFTVAGEGRADRILPGLALDADKPPAPHELDDALAGADVVVVENVCSLPLNRRAAEAVASSLVGRPALLHHHDLPWQRPATSDASGFPPDDPAWVHVTVNWLSRDQLRRRGVAATAIPNCFDTDVRIGDRDRTRRRLGVHAGERLLVQPTRAIPRKNVPEGLALAAAVGASYWLVGPAEDGYEPQLAADIGEARCRVIRGLPEGCTIADAYAAGDAVALPSTWEGFGNPTVESAIHRRALAVGRYPVAREIGAYGFRWFPTDDPAPLAGWFERPDSRVLDINQAIARRHFSLDALATRLGALIRDAGWPVP